MVEELEQTNPRLKKKEKRKNLLEKLKGERRPEESLAAHPNAALGCSCSGDFTILFFASLFWTEQCNVNSTAREDAFVFIRIVAVREWRTEEGSFFLPKYPHYFVSYSKLTLVHFIHHYFFFDGPFFFFPERSTFSNVRTIKNI